jgi:hypothetical protein
MALRMMTWAGYLSVVNRERGRVPDLMVPGHKTTGRPARFDWHQTIPVALIKANKKGITAGDLSPSSPTDRDGRHVP